MQSSKFQTTTTEETQGTQREGDASAGPDPILAESSTASGLPRDVVFDLLSVTRRRQLLRYLDDNGGKAPLGELAREIAARENDVPVQQVSSSQRKRVYVGLYQSHVPKMADAGVVDFDKQGGTVSLAANAADLFPYLYFDPSGANSDGVTGRVSGLVSGLTGVF